MDQNFEIFLACPPGLEPMLEAEALELGFAGAGAVPGGVTFRGDWNAVARANVTCRGASRVLVRLAEFRAFHLAQLDKRARKIGWAAMLRPDVPVRVEATSRKSKIYHAGAARQRIERAVSDGAGVTISEEATLVLKARIEDDLVTISVDTSGEALHKRGHKEWVGKAPMRETMAALLLRACGFDGDMPVFDPMCGSGTFVLEAAEIAAGLDPGRDRYFAFEDMSGPDSTALQELRRGAPRQTSLRFHGSDRDQGAIAGATSNADRAGVGHLCSFSRCAVSDIAPPEGPPGLVMINPPYGARIGNRKQLFGLYGSLGQTLAARFRGWRVGLVTSDAGLARATGLSLSESAPIAHGGLKVKLFQAGPLG